MSEFLAEARVVVLPDTTKFRAELEAQLQAATSKPVVVPVVASSAGITAATTEIERNAAATQAAGAAKTRSAIATREFTRQETLAAEASRALAASQQVVAGAASEVGAAQIVLTRSTAAVAVAEKALAAAVKAKNIALIDGAAQSLRLAAAQEQEALTALAAARAQAQHARSLDAVGTAALANTASMLGLRGAVLTAGAAFLGATIAFQAVSRSIKEASDATEEFNKAQVVFGDSADQITNFAETTASSLGIASTEALRAAGIFGNLFRSINIATPAAAAMSEALVRLASDLASFNNADPSQVLDNLRSGLVGEPEPLRKFGIFLSQVRAQQEALIETGKKSITQLTQAEIVQARYNLILQDGEIAAGDFANTQDQFANTTRTLKAEIQDLEGDLGAALIPTLTDTAGLLTDVAKGFKVAADRAKEFKAALPGGGGGGDSKLGFLTQSLPASLREITAAFEVLEKQSTLTFGELPSTTLRRLNEEANNSAEGVGHLGDALDAGARAARLAAFAIVSANEAIAGLGQSLNALEVSQLKIQTGLSPGGRSAEEANLRQQIELDKQNVEAAKSGSAARLKALRELKSDQDALAALQAKDAQDAKANATSVKSAATDAQRAQDEADRALLGLLSNRRSDAERRAANAGQTAGLQDDIRSQNALQALIKVQIAKIRERVKDEESRRDAIRELRIALIASRNEEDALRKEQKENAINTRVSGIELDIELADINENEARQVALRRRLIAQLRKKAKDLHLTGNALKENRNAIARINQEIEDIQKEQEKTGGADKKGQTAQQFFFEQLQAQQGFASNLLGNLIPSGQTSGLVGVPSPTTGPGRGVSVAASVQEAKASSGPTAGQANATINRLDKIIAQLQELNGDQKNPEAHRQRKGQHAVMDYGAGGGDGVVM